ncbi:MAG: transporter substrate-binding protein [Paenibacillaceae bacterium]|nr:transporter substrate-binding protein [Paenibacillaceae bacterium]
MKFKKSMIQGSVAILSGAVLVSGCGSSSEGSQPTASVPAASTAPAATATAQATKGPPVTLKLAVSETWPGVSYDNASIKYIEEKTNTKLEITTTTEDKLNIMLASGERPDIVQFGKDATEWKYSKSGLLLPINDYFDKAPNLKAYGADGIWDAMKHEDGKIYAIPIKGSTIDNIPLYRKDWLDKLNLKVPTTVEEFIAVAEAISNNDPDGNGKKDTYALSGFNTGNNGFDLASWDHVFGAHGVLPNFWIEQDGKIVNGSVANGALDALKVLNRLYKNKAIDLEFVTDNSARFKDKIIKGVIGAPVYRTFVLDPNNLNNYYTPMKQHNPNAEFVEGGILKGPGKSIGYRTLTKRGWLKTAVLKDSKNVDAAVRLLDYLASDEGNRFVNYGEKGKHYTEENGLVKRTITDEQMKVEGVTQLRLAYNSLFDHTSKRFQDVRKFAESISYTSPVEGIFIEDNTKEGELGAYASTQYTKMITNEGPIDDMFNEFVKEWNKRGGQELTKAYDDAYQKKAAK